MHPWSKEASVQAKQFICLSNNIIYGEYITKKNKALVVILLL